MGDKDTASSFLGNLSWKNLELNLAGIADAAADSPLLGALLPGAAVVGTAGKALTGAPLAPQVYAAQVAESPDAETIGSARPNAIAAAAKRGASPEELRALALKAANNAEEKYGGPAGLEAEVMRRNVKDGLNAVPKGLWAFLTEFWAELPAGAQLAIAGLAGTVALGTVGFAVYQVRSAVREL